MGTYRLPRNLLGLTERQMRLIRLAAANRSHAEISCEVYMSRDYVSSELSRAHRALGFTGANSGVATGYVVGVFDAGRPKAARALCPAYAHEAIDLAAL